MVAARIGFDPALIDVASSVAMWLRNEGFSRVEKEMSTS